MEDGMESLVERFTREQKERVVEKCRAGSSSEAPAKKDRPRPAEQSSARLLNSPLAGALRRVGHTQMLLLADKGFPVPPNVETIDLALSDDVPTILDVIRAISDDFSFDRVLITQEMRDVSAHRVAELEKLTGKPLEVFPHIEFKHIAAHARLCVRTGDATPYANCILVCG
jgi:D-ribose pyranase